MNADVALFLFDVKMRKHIRCINIKGDNVIAGGRSLFPLPPSGSLKPQTVFLHFCLMPN